MTGTDTRDIDVASIDPDPTQPRKHFDPAALQLLATSIARVGVMQPIMVREKGDGRYELVMGERRWRASVIAGVPTIHAQVVDMEDGAAFLLAVTENTARLDMRPMEEAQAYQRLMDGGMTLDEVTDVVGRRQSDIIARLRLLALVPAAQEAVNLGVLPVSLAGALATVSAAAQIVVLGKWSAGRYRDVQAALDEVEMIRESELTPVMFGDDNLDPGPTPTQRARARRQVAAVERLARALHSLDSVDTVAATGDGQALCRLLEDVTTKASALYEELDAALAKRSHHV